MDGWSQNEQKLYLQGMGGKCAAVFGNNSEWMLVSSDCCFRSEGCSQHEIVQKGADF